MRLFTTILIMTVFAFGATAQVNTFKILTLSGNSTVKIGENKNQLKPGMVLSGEFTLEVTKESYIGLVHNSGNLLELREVGEYQARELYSMAKTGKSNTLVTKYTDYLLNKMADEDVNRRLSATGAVERSYDPFSKEVRLFIPDVSQLYGEEVIIEWDDKTAKSTVEVMNLFEEVLYTESVEGKRYTLDVTNPSLQDENVFVIRVSQEGDKVSEAIKMKKMDGSVKDKHAKNLEEITANIKNSALLELIRAAYFEDNNLLADAFTCYVNAMLIENDVQDYKDAYESFLVRNKLLQNI